jgi:hypothetical protein
MTHSLRENAVLIRGPERNGRLATSLRHRVSACICLVNRPIRLAPGPDRGRTSRSISTLLFPGTRRVEQARQPGPAGCTPLAVFLADRPAVIASIRKQIKAPLKDGRCGQRHPRRTLL